MSNLILKVRLESLIANLQQVRGLTRSVKTREKETKELRTLLEEASKLVKDVKTYARFAHDLRAEKIDEIKTNISLVVQLVEVLDTQVGTAQGLLDGMKDRLVPVQERLEFTLQNDLDTKTNDWLKKLRNTRKKLNQANINGGILEQAWKEANHEQNQFGFSDYVDFLSGLALRDKGWDNSICDIADELISSCGNLIQAQLWDALTIPSSHGAVTLARIIRMGFSEWTFWGLPLTAYQLGLVTVNADDDLSSIIEEDADDPQTRREAEACLADGLATCIMGPAYACAALLLRFNPSLAYEGRYDAVDAQTLRNTFGSFINDTLDRSETGSLDKTAIEQLIIGWNSVLEVSLRRAKALSDAQRAYVILRTLGKMYGQCKAKASFDSSIIQLLETEWNNAIQQAKPSGSPGSKERLDKWVDALFTYISQNTLGAIYCGTYWEWTKEKLMEIHHNDDPDTVWITSKEKADEQQKAGQNVKYLELQNSIELRDVINAAWACRIDRLSTGDEEIDGIDASAFKLWKCIKEKKKSDQESVTGKRAGIKPPISTKTKK